MHGELKTIEEKNQCNLWCHKNVYKHTDDSTVSPVGLPGILSVQIVAPPPYVLVESPDTVLRCGRLDYKQIEIEH